MENRARRFVSDLAKGDALLPVVLLEATVIAGRTYHAYDRGGFVEARERGTEEILGAIFWLGGVAAFNKMGDALGKKLLKLDDVDFEVGKDAVRDPLKNYQAKIPKYGKKTLAAFKFTKIASSILLANAVIGFIVPKLNQAITNKYQKSLEEMDKKRENSDNKDGFIKNTDNKESKGTSFKGSGVQALLSMAHNFENDAKYKLISTDAGIAGGRAINARNKHERREILFRDLSSIYFYMFCKNHINSLLNLLTSGRTNRLDPVSTNTLDTHLRENLQDKKSYTAEEFEKLVLGDKNTQIPERVQNTMKNGIIELDEFKKIVGDNSGIAKRAEEMSKLQPKIGNVSILTAEQVKDVYSNGLIDNPKMLNQVFEQYSDKKSTNPMKYFPEKDLRDLKQRMIDYVQDIIKKSKSTGEGITLNTLKKANKANMIKNSINIGAGFAVSAYFLSTAIPKIQYWMTRRRTGEDKFPGVQKYDK